MSITKHVGLEPFTMMKYRQKEKLDCKQMLFLNKFLTSRKFLVTLAQQHFQ